MVAPLCGQHGLQLGIADAFLDHFPQRAADPALDVVFLPPHQSARDDLRHRMRREDCLERLAGGAHAVEVTIDAGRFRGKADLQRLHQARDRVLELDGHPGKVHTVVDRSHRRHRDSMRRQDVEDLLRRPDMVVGVARATDVMHADVEPVAVALEGLGQATELVVALDDEHTLAFTRERCGCGQSADAGTDDDDVPLRHDAPPEPRISPYPIASGVDRGQRASSSASNANDASQCVPT